MDRGVVDLTGLIADQRLRGITILVAVLCGLVAVLDGIDSQAIAIAATPIAHMFGMTIAGFGPVFSIGLAGGVIGALVCGSLSDAFGRKRVLVAATVLFAVFTILTASVGSYEALLAVRFAAGLGLGGAVPCFLAMACEYAPPTRRGTLASLLWAGFPLGGMLGGFLNAFLVSHYGWQAIFLVDGAVPLVVALAMLVLLPESPAFLATRDPASPALRKIAERISGRSFESGTRFVITEPKLVGVPVTQLFAAGRRIATPCLWIAFAASFGLLGLVVYWTPAILQGLGMPPASTATVLGFHGLGAVIGMGSAGRLVDRFGARATLIPAFLVAAVCTYLLAAVGSVAAASLVMALIGVFLGAGASGLIAVSSYVYPTEMRATGIGWGMGMGRFGQVIGPLVVGRLLMGGTASGTVVEMIAVLALVAALAVAMLQRPEPAVVAMPVAAG